MTDASAETPDTTTSTAKPAASTPAKKATAKKAATKKAPAKKATAKKATTKKATGTTRTTPATPPLHERAPRVVLEDAGYAVAGLTADVVDFARHLPERVETLRTEAPAKLRDRVEGVRKRVDHDVRGWVGRFEEVIDTKAAEGRKATATVRSDERVQKVLKQTGNTRKQVKAALTSVRKTADVAREATHEQAETARQQTKAAATSATKTAKTVTESVKEI